METHEGARLPAARAAHFPLEIALTWTLFAFVGLANVVTYSRIPVDELYHVSHGGLPGGLGRAVVFANFPLALVAIPILAILGERLVACPARIAAAVGIVLSAAVYWPGVVDEADLDVRAVNAVATLGVLVAIGLTVVAARGLPRPTRLQRQRGDVLRAVLGVAVILIAVPWIAADLGFHLDVVPLLDRIYQTGELRAQPGVQGLHPAVHYGHHHGMDGVLLVLSALLLSRTLATVRAGWLRYALGAYLALMLCYGVGNVANDAWLEQVVKRGWTDWAIPNVTTPHASVAWLVLVASAAALFVASVRTGERRHRDVPVPAKSS
jgi:hypothetical protein